MPARLLGGVGTQALYTNVFSVVHVKWPIIIIGNISHPLGLVPVTGPEKIVKGTKLVGSGPKCLTWDQKNGPHVSDISIWVIIIPSNKGCVSIEVGPNVSKICQMDQILKRLEKLWVLATFSITHSFESQYRGKRWKNKI